MSVVINAIIVLLFLLLIWLIILLQRRNQQKLERIAFCDPVTGGFNRARFDMEATQMIQSAPPNTYALVSLDIEKFKLINDTYGSEMGDATLKYIHNTIKKHLHPDELIARISADTFNLLLKQTSREEIKRRQKECVNDVNRFNHSLSKKYFFPFYVGVYVIDDPELNLITIQDRANVARKSNKPGKGHQLSNVVFYSDLERLKMIQEKEIENRMETALKAGEFIVYLQPKYELENNTVAGAEALVRWKDPEKGLIPPNDFIPVFERNGFITMLDLYMFEEVCRLLQKWTLEGRQPLSISINLSRVHLDNPDFLKEYEAVFSQYTIPAECIEIELTETMIFDNPEELRKLIDEIHRLGFKCALDDFGSGYSSLNILKDIPADVIKLDSVFFGDQLESDPIVVRAKKVIESVIDLAKKLDMQTVAEGVEVQAQVDFLRKAGCDMVQGYIFSQPLSVEEFEQKAFGTEQH